MQRLYADVAVAAPGAQYVKPSRETDAAIAGRSVAFAIQVTGVNGPMGGVQADCTLQRTHSQSAITTMQVNGAGHVVGLDGSVARSHLQIRILRHANLNMQPSSRVHGEMPPAGNARGEFNLITVLIGFDLQRLM